jgi:hypothetical protein
MGRISRQNFVAAHERTMLTYGPLNEALRAYLAEGWHVVIVCSLPDNQTIQEVLDFLTRRSDGRGYRKRLQ